MPKRLIIHDHQFERRLFMHRIAFCLILFSIFLVFLYARHIYLQVIQHKLYTTLSQQNRVEVVPLSPNRGLIYDRNGTLIAENEPVFSLEITPSQVVDLPTTIKTLQTFIAINSEDIRDFYKQKRQRPHFSKIPLKLKLTQEEVAHFAVNQQNFPGVSVNAHLLRHYPLSHLFGHVVGYVGRINAAELKQVDATNYSATNFIGKIGIEKFYESILHGTVGYEEVEVDASGRAIRRLKHVAPIPGNNLFLTIDTELQMTAQQALGTLRGAVIAIKPATGEILAMVSNPSYDPNLFVEGISQSNYKMLTASPDQPLYDRALRGQYPFGSVIKPFLALEGLLKGVITPDEELYDRGTYLLKNSTHVYHDWKAHGWVNLYKAIAVSCDIYFYELANKMGIESMATILDRFGFGKPTHIDLNDELAGLVPTPAWKQKNKHSAWYPGDTLISGIGQGFMLTTPLQLAKATAMLAMHGQLIQPHLLQRSQSTDQTTASTIPSIPTLVVEADETLWNAIIDGMHAVVTEPFGTGYRFHYGKKYTAAGKTGTAQVYRIDRSRPKNSIVLPEKLHDNSLFISFAPIENPAIAVVVVVENNTQAGFIAKAVMDHYLTKSDPTSKGTPS